jgi:ferritin-like metal-binding protein YciE
MSTTTNISKLFESELKDIYDAEQRIEEALGELSSEVDDDELKTAFEEHREETRTHIDRLEQVFDILDIEPGDEECEATKGLVEEHDEFANESPSQAELELFDLTAAQKTEHYEIASYGNLAKIADQLGQEEVGDLLHQTLEEEEETLNELTELAERFDYSRLQS